MRRAFLLLSAVLAAVAMSAFSSAWAQSQDQYSSSGATPEEPAAEPTSPSPDDGAQDTTVSQGSVLDSTAAREAAEDFQADVAEEERLPDYSQIVDNSTRRRFTAPRSKTTRDGTAYGGTYAQTGARGASFRVKVPTTSDYAVYAWWPSGSSAKAARYAVPVTGSRTRTTTVNQSRDGGDWVKVGVFELAAGQRKIRLAPKGNGPRAVAADALLIVRGQAAAPPEDSYPSDQRSGEISTRNTIKERRSVVRSARKWMGTPYRYATCKSSRMSCTCLTKRAWNPHGHTLPRTEGGQWRYEPSKKIRKSNLRRGDVVFFKEGGSSKITHVAVYSGNGYVVHASTYFGKVAESKMKYVTGYHGAIRMQVR